MLRELLVLDLAELVPVPASRSGAVCPRRKGTAFFAALNPRPPSWNEPSRGRGIRLPVGREASGAAEAPTPMSITPMSICRLWTTFSRQSPTSQPVPGPAQRTVSP